MSFNLEELKRILPQLIKEDDAIRGAIISALSEIMVTRDDLKLLVEEMRDGFKQMDGRFEKMDSRFEELAIQNQKGFAELRQAISVLSVSISRIESKEGHLLENTILNLLKESLLLEKISPEDVRKENLIDKEGLVFYPNYSSDIDVVVDNGNIYLFEIKATVYKSDTDHFLQNVRLYEKVKNVKITAAFIISLRMSSQSYKHALNQSIRVINGDIM